MREKLKKNLSNIQMIEIFLKSIWKIEDFFYHWEPVVADIANLSGSDDIEMV